MTPYYNRPSAAGLSAHFRAVAGATDLPVVLYDIPVRSGRRIGAALTLELARQVPNIVGVKDSTGDVAGAATVVAESPDGFDVYCGDDSLTLPFMSIGAAGVISVAAHWAGRLFAEMIRSYRAGDVGRATLVNQHLAESYRFESTDEFPNPVPAKAACRAQGLAVGQCRLPERHRTGGARRGGPERSSRGWTRTTRRTNRLPDRVGTGRGGRAQAVGTNGAVGRDHQ